MQMVHCYFSALCSTLTSKQKRELIDKSVRDSLGFELIKSVMVGTEYYGAVRESGGQVICVSSDVSVHKGTLICPVFTEYENPCNYRCPESIFRMLTALPLKSEYDGARQWRSKCMANLQREGTLKKIKGYPVGTVLEVTDESGEVKTVVYVESVRSRKFYVIQGTYKIYPMTTRNFAKVKVLSMPDSN